MGEKKVVKKGNFHEYATGKGNKEGVRGCCHLWIKSWKDRIQGCSKLIEN